MTKDELVRKIIFITGAAYAEKQIRDAVEAYSAASNGAKPIVGRSLLSDEDAGKIFESYSDCYADTWEDAGYALINGCHAMKEGDVIQAMTKERFIEAIKLVLQ